MGLGPLGIDWYEGGSIYIYTGMSNILEIYIYIGMSMMGHQYLYIEGRAADVKLF